MECTCGARATFLWRLEKIGSVQPPLYLFVLGLSLKAKAIKQKTTGDPKKWKVHTWFFSSVGMQVHVRRPNSVTNILSFINKYLLSSYCVPGGLPWWLSKSACQCKRYGFDHSSILAWEIPMNRGAWWATVHEVTKELDVT